jgi:hypothetical protein
MATVFGLLGGGCSLLYNPSNIDTAKHDAAIDAEPDASIDADPSNLILTSVDAPTLFEGQGDGGSRQAVLVIHGVNIVGDAGVAITGNPMLQVGTPVVSSDSTFMAVPVTALVDPALHAGAPITLTVTVTQTAGSGSISKAIDWHLQGFEELTGASATIDTATAQTYSTINLSGTLNPTGTGRLIAKANGSISIDGTITVSASGQTAGPGGASGGPAQAPGNGPGNGKPGNTSSQGGGGAGFEIAGVDGQSNANSGGTMTGDRLITSYVSNQGSGGGGAAGVGGGGGGTIELSAGGSLSCAQINAKGGNGQGGLGTGGGGGSGGVIVLRSGAAMTIGAALDVGFGTGGGGTIPLANGGDGRAGRARIDAVTITGGLGPAHRGVMFDPTTELISRTPMVTIKLIGSAGDRFDLQPVDATYAPAGAKTPIDFGGATTLDPMVAAKPGWNRFCVVPENGSVANDESRNCIDIAYLP